MSQRLLGDRVGEGVHRPLIRRLPAVLRVVGHRRGQLGAEELAEQGQGEVLKDGTGGTGNRRHCSFACLT